MHNLLPQLFLLWSLHSCEPNSPTVAINPEWKRQEQLMIFHFLGPEQDSRLNIKMPSRSCFIIIKEQEQYSFCISPTSSPSLNNKWHTTPKIYSSPLFVVCPVVSCARVGRVPRQLSSGNRSKIKFHYPLFTSSGQRLDFGRFATQWPYRRDVLLKDSYYIPGLPCASVAFRREITCALYFVIHSLSSSTIG